MLHKSSNFDTCTDYMNSRLYLLQSFLCSFHWTKLTKNTQQEFSQNSHSITEQNTKKDLQQTSNLNPTLAMSSTGFIEFFFFGGGVGVALIWKDLKKIKKVKEIN